MKKSSVFFLVLTGAALLTSYGIVRATRPSAGMSDEQILRFMKLDPAAMRMEKPWAKTATVPFTKTV